MKPESAKLLEKASRAIRTAEMSRQSDNDSAASRAYYAMFYCAKALLFEKESKDFSKHATVHGAYGKEFAKTGALDSKYHRWLIQAFDKRLKADYSLELVLKVEDVELMLQQAREFLEAARQYLSAK